jgi:hypothetical protein
LGKKDNVLSMNGSLKSILEKCRLQSEYLLENAQGRSHWFPPDQSFSNSALSQPSHTQPFVFFYRFAQLSPRQTQTSPNHAQLSPIHPYSSHFFPNSAPFLLFSLFALAKLS